jgi:hypothetical protein
MAAFREFNHLQMSTLCISSIHMCVRVHKCECVFVCGEKDRKTERERQRTTEREKARVFHSYNIFILDSENTLS